MLHFKNTQIRQTQHSKKWDAVAQKVDQRSKDVVMDMIQ